MRVEKTCSIQFLPPGRAENTNISSLFIDEKEKPVFGLWVGVGRWVAAGHGTKSIATFNTLEAASAAAIKMGYRVIS